MAGAPQNSSFTLQRRLRNARIKAFDIIDKFKYGYRNREDQTNLPAGVLVSGSKNVFTNVSDRVGIRQGYALDGPASTITTSIDSAFTYQNHLGTELNLRSYVDPTNDGVLQFRYQNPSTGLITWENILTGLTSTSFNYTAWWDNPEQIREMLAVNGTANIYEWSGAYGAIASTSSASGVITQLGGLVGAGVYNVALGGSGYVLGDVLSISGGTVGTVKVLSLANTYYNVVNSVSLLTGGFGYAVGSIATIPGYIYGGTAAEVIVTSVDVAGAATGIELIQQGSGYPQTSGSVTAGGIVPATGTATVSNGAVTGITLTSLNGNPIGGSGYTSNPTISFSTVNGATASVLDYVGTGIFAIGVTNGGTGYTSAPTVNIYGDGHGATATAVISGGAVTSITVTAAGTGYSIYNTYVVLEGGGITAANAVGQVTNGVVTSVTILNGGNGYSTAPTVSFNGGGGGSGLTFSYTATNTAVASVEIITPGSGYSITPYTTPRIGNLTTGGTGSGAYVIIDQVGTGGITLSGTQTWGQLGFYSNPSEHGSRAVTIDGVSYTYTGGEATQTLVGISPTPSGISSGDLVFQTPIISTADSTWAITPVLTQIDLISSFIGQLWIGSYNNNNIYVSCFGGAIGGLIDLSHAGFTNPTISTWKYFQTSNIGASGYGQVFTLDAPPTSFNPLENLMTVSAGKNQWYEFSLVQAAWNTTLSSKDLTYQVDTWITNRLKTTANQGAQSQTLVSAMKNDLIFVSYEPTLDRLGRVEDILNAKQTTNISDSIKLDFDNYDFTDGQVWYNKYFIYVSVPKDGLVLVYNIVKSYWEAPQTIPVGKFYTVNGILYGHSYYTPESYQLFTGLADRVDPVTNPNGNSIDAKVTFSFNNYGSPFTLKNFDEFYVEGYMNLPTTLTLGIQYDLNGCATNTSYTLNGNNSQYVCIQSGAGVTDDVSLGKNPLGSYPLGSDLNITNPSNLPPKFRVIQTFPRTDFFEDQISFESNQVGAYWEVLRFGPSIDYASTIPANIKI
jgi:hypothetical protein